MWSVECGVWSEISLIRQIRREEEMKKIEWSDFSKYRSALMGAAMLFVMFFHVTMPKSYMMYGVVRCGNIGVDMFLFLSGIGLWYSWTAHHGAAVLYPQLPECGGWRI